MKTLILTTILILGLSFTGCSKENTIANNIVTEAIADDTIAIAELHDSHKDLYGLYSGSFDVPDDYLYDEDLDEDSDYSAIYKTITLKINRIHNDSVYGHSIVNGNQRPFTGLYNDATKSFVLDEPGDNNSDGRFEVKLNEDSLSGNWKVYNKSKVKFPEKTLKLKRKEFVYNPNFMLDEGTDLIDWTNPKEFIEKFTDEETGETTSYTETKYRSSSEEIFKLNPSKEKLTEKQLKNLRKMDLEILKNSIYARHGYSFKKPTFRYFFEATDWYIPAFDNVDDELTEIEKENLEILVRFIKYAEDKYDYFGR